MQRNAEDAARLLRALANPQRLRILCLLVGGEMSVGNINARIDLSQSALSQHLAVLREEHLVSTRREAQTIHYALLNGPAQVIIETLHGIYCSPKKSRGNTQRVCAS
ncbi:metalloregulator ArsR/SmtB family transcription factor [Metallibacterium sp.]|uniref:ArsR/SmtB family transcription factor n=1 Tax=Metallibacterium sp. TaxID=2940281 RepID=UPI0026363F3D|nr:metalloregulator ArsR/SmtB family transcription factor [Metallibacterium sp.]